MGVFVLSLDIGAHDTERVQFVGADAAVEQFIPTCRRVEVPALLTALQRDGEWEIVLAKLQLDHVVGLAHQGDLLLQGRAETLEGLAILDRVFGVQDVLRARAEDRHQGRVVLLLDGLGERDDGFQRGVELALSGAGRRKGVWHRQRHEQADEGEDGFH